MSFWLDKTHFNLRTGSHRVAPAIIPIGHGEMLSEIARRDQRPEYDIILKQMRVKEAPSVWWSSVTLKRDVYRVQSWLLYHHIDAEKYLGRIEGILSIKVEEEECFFVVLRHFTNPEVLHTQRDGTLFIQTCDLLEQPAQTIVVALGQAELKILYAVVHRDAIHFIKRP